MSFLTLVCFGHKLLSLPGKLFSLQSYPCPPHTPRSHPSPLSWNPTHREPFTGAPQQHLELSFLFLSLLQLLLQQFLTLGWQWECRDVSWLACNRPLQFLESKLSHLPLYAFSTQKSVAHSRLLAKRFWMTLVLHGVFIHIDIHTYIYLSISHTLHVQTASLIPRNWRLPEYGPMRCFPWGLWHQPCKMCVSSTSNKRCRKLPACFRNTFEIFPTEVS